MKISWTEHRSNQEVLDMADENSSLMNTIRQWQKNWLRGHMLRNESLLCTVLEGRMEGTRTRGRQSATMIDWMKSNDVEYEHIKKRSYDREDWRHWRPGPAWNGRALRGEIVDRKWSTYIAISEKHKYVVQGTTTEPAPELANRETVVEHFALWLMKQIWSKSDLVEGRTDARTHGRRFWKQYQPGERVKMKRQGHNVNLYLRLNSDTKWHKKVKLHGGPHIVSAIGFEHIRVCHSSFINILCPNERTTWGLDSGYLQTVFLPCDAMHKRGAYAVVRCIADCLSRSCIVSKRQKIRP